MKILKNLVISGAGINGIGFLGIIKYLNEFQLLDNICHYIGTSAGSIISFLLSIGYSYQELYEFSLHFNFNKVVNDINLNNFLDNFGFENIGKLYYILKRLCEEKGLNENITFKEHFDKTNIKLTITGSCLNESKVHYFNYETFPDMKILTAIKISCCIPIIFMPIKFNNKLWLDGGLLNNYPIKFCEDEIDNTLGITINDECLDKCEDNTPTNIMDYLYTVLKCIIYSDNIKYINDFKENTIKFTYSFNEISNFNITKEDKIKLIELGYIHAKTHHSIIEKFVNINLQKSDSNTISEPLSDSIHQIIKDVENNFDNNDSITLSDSIHKIIKDVENDLDNDES